MPSLMDLLQDEESKTPEPDQPEQAEPPFDFGSYLADTVQALSDAGISPMDLPEKERHAAFALEPQIHDAETENRQEDFIRLVDQWKEYFQPVAVKINSSILGATVDVSLEPDQAVVDGVEYSNGELTDLISRGLPSDGLRAVHEVKRTFQGQVVSTRQSEGYGRG